ncbi:hypothetical protein M0G43_02150 [Subsaxibacter sp. CAU 1640]|uniref:hypothetical protein n=1 Tax=Subsaxibacter sp. CAU 1640 TaxID=2933271 RepID=UPI002005F707|nr:hypothetical protein [Subsaxibacter sp. CAU 1640]MCK7589367.1 hypothetical protein [Subsaxibacter sp. CAU 1640]
MKKIISLLAIVIVLVSCKSDKKNEVENEVETIETPLTSDESLVSGNFMYYADAAVFQTKSELFGVVENQMLQDLIIQSEPLKTDATDEVKVTLRVKKSKKPENEEGWDNRIEILEIIKVSMADPNDNNIIKLGKDSNAKNQ